MVSKRFDYVKYDEKAANAQAAFKEKFIEIENMISEIGPAVSAINKAYQKLEECYMWVGKAIRDDQRMRNTETQLQEGRKDG